MRGEVFIPLDVFQRENAAREERGEPRFANPRNAAAGAIVNSIRSSSLGESSTCSSTI